MPHSPCVLFRVVGNEGEGVDNYLYLCLCSFKNTKCTPPTVHPYTTYLQPDEPHGGQPVHRHHLLLEHVLRPLHQA